MVSVVASWMDPPIVGTVERPIFKTDAQIPKPVPNDLASTTFGTTAHKIATYIEKPKPQVIKGAIS